MGFLPEEYFDELKINKYELDEMCATQASLYMKYATIAADAYETKQQLEHDLDIIKAEVDSEVRNNPESFGLDDSPKEKAISYVVLKDPRVVDINKQFLEARRESAIVDAAKNAFEQRKIMIRVLGDLWLGEYYSNAEVKKADMSKFRKKMGSGSRQTK